MSSVHKRAHVTPLEKQRYDQVMELMKTHGGSFGAAIRRAGLEPVASTLYYTKKKLENGAEVALLRRGGDKAPRKYTKKASPRVETIVVPEERPHDSSVTIVIAPASLIGVVLNQINGAHRV